MGHEHISTAFVAAFDKFRRGLDTPERLAIQLAASNRRISVPREDIIRTIQEYDPNFRVTKEDLEQMPAREQRSNDYHLRMVQYYQKRSEILLEVDLTGAGRQAQHFLDYSGTEEGRRHNEKWAPLLRSKNEDTANAMFEYITETLLPLAMKALDASSDEFMKNIGPYTEACNAIMEIEGATSGIPFTEEQKKKLDTLRCLQTPLTQALHRLDVISSPLYGMIPVEKISREAGSDQHLLADLKFLENPNMVSGKGTFRQDEGPLTTSAGVLYGYSAQQSLSMFGYVDYAVRAAGGDPKFIFSADGKLLNIEQTGDTLLASKPVLAFVPGKGVVPFLATPNQDPPGLYKEPGPAYDALARSVENKAADLLRQCKDADPWWMTTGSQEYSDMKQALTEISRLTKGMQFPVDAENSAQLLSAIQDLRVASQAYLDHKQAQAEDDMTGPDGLLQGKNARETARLRAAAAAADLGSQMEFLLTCQLSPETVRDSAAVVYTEQEAEAARERARRLEELRRQDQENRIVEKAEALPENEQCPYSKQDMMAKVKGYKDIPRPELLHPHDLLPRMYDSLYTRNGMMVNKISGRTTVLDSSEQNAVYDAMGLTAFYYLIKQERVLNPPKEGEPFQPGPIESYVISKPHPITVHNDPVFRKLIGEPVTPARAAAYLMNDEAKTIGIEYLKALGKSSQIQTGNNPPVAEDPQLNQQGIGPAEPQSANPQSAPQIGTM